MSNPNTYVYVLLFMLLIVDLDSTLTKKDKDKKRVSTKKTSVDDGISSHLDHIEVLRTQAHVDYSDFKKFSGASLGYVTPWNGHGYDVAKFLAHKFTHISPVWFQLRQSENDAVGIRGTHDVDQGWVSQVRKNNSEIKIVPRFLFDRWSPQQFQMLFTLEHKQQEFATFLADYLQRSQFDGCVLEIWVQVMSMSQGSLANELIHFIINIAEALRARDLEFILVVPPAFGAKGQPTNMFTPEHFITLVPYVDYFNVMTYDHPNTKPPGPVAPIDWVKRCIDVLIPHEMPELSQKILMGLNFYGYHYFPSGSKMEPIVGRQFVELLEKHKSDLVWSKQAAEHFIEFQKGHVAYYPSLYSLDARLTLANDLQVGIGIWEIGQGLDYFLNLL